MADITDRLIENQPGLFYVDSTCIDCDQCRAHAPAFFARNDEIGSSVVSRQPITSDEIALCDEALEGCPTESIGREDLE
jgi:ferredoxin